MSALVYLFLWRFLGSFGSDPVRTDRNPWFTLEKTPLLSGVLYTLNASDASSVTEYALIPISWNLKSKELEASSPDDKFRSDLDLFGWQVVIAKSI